MPQVSKYPLTPPLRNRIYDIFLKMIISLKTRKETSLFLSEFLTPTEHIMLTKRLAIAFLLARGYTYREIEKVLRVSTSTVGSVSLSLHTSKYYKKIVTKMLKDKDLEEFILNSGEKVAELFAAGGSKSGSWRYIKESIRKKRGRKPF